MMTLVYSSTHTHHSLQSKKLYQVLEIGRCNPVFWRFNWTALLACDGILGTGTRTANYRCEASTTLEDIQRIKCSGLFHMAWVLKSVGLPHMSCLAFKYAGIRDACKSPLDCSCTGTLVI